MPPDDGRNPLRWNCELRGCFNVIKRPKIEVFADCFPGRIAMSDVDGIVEISGNFLLMEWKPAAGAVPTGQHVMFMRLTRVAPFLVVVVVGDARTMVVERYCVYRRGALEPWREGTIDGVRELFRRWAADVLAARAA